MRNAVSAPRDYASLEEPAYPSTAQLRQLFHLSGDFICSIDQENRFVHVSDACRTLLGYAPGEMIGQCVSSFLYEEDLRKTVVAGEALIRGEDAIRFENRYHKKDGSLITISWSCKWDPKEGLLFCTGRDVSEKKAREALQKQFEEKIKRQNRQMSEMLERITDGFFALDEEWRITYANSQCEKIVGVNREDYLARNLWDCFPDLIGTIYHEQYTKAMREKQPVSFNAYIERFASWFEVNAYPSQTGLSVFFRNITEQKNSGEALRLSNERFQLAAKNDAIYDWDIVSNDLQWGEGLYYLFGYYPHQFQMSAWEEAVHPDDYEPVMEDLCRTLKDRQVADWKKEYRIRKEDGSYCYVFERGHIVRNREGQAIRMVGVMQDIQERKQAEEQLKENERKYRHLFNNAPLPQWIFDLQTYQVLDVNEATLNHYGYTREEVLQLTIFQIRPEEDVPRLRESLKKYPDKKDWGVSRHLKKDGTIILVEVSSTNLVYEGKTVRLATINDVTEKIQLERKVIELKVAAQKEISKTQIKVQEEERALLGRELHDNVNAMLTTAKLYLDLARSREETRLEFIGKSEKIILSAIQEIRSLSRSLVPPILKDIDFSSAIDELLDSYSVAQPFAIHCSYINSLQMLSDDVKLTFYRIVQEQLTNIIKYAAAKNVWIEFDCLESSICLRIKDDGLGFDTTQRKGGVGLTNIKNRVELFNGSMSVNSSPGEGCLLLVSLPFENSFR